MKRNQLSPRNNCVPAARGDHSRTVGLHSPRSFTTNQPPTSCHTNDHLDQHYYYYSVHQCV